MRSGLIGASIIIFTALPLSACAASKSSAQSMQRRRGTLAGRIYKEGGPLLRRGAACRAQTCPSAGVVTVKSGSTTVAKRNVNARRPFKIALAPGMYRVTAGDGCGVKSVEIKMDAVAHVRLVCQIK